MAIAPTFQRYLDQKVIYDVIAHEPTMSSMRTAQACHVPGDCLAKLEHAATNSFRLDWIELPAAGAARNCYITNN